jgi:hypothetical protein
MARRIRPRYNGCPVARERRHQALIQRDQTLVRPVFGKRPDRNLTADRSCCRVLYWHQEITPIDIVGATATVGRALADALAFLLKRCGRPFPAADNSALSRRVQDR